MSVLCETSGVFNEENGYSKVPMIRFSGEIPTDKRIKDTYTIILIGKEFSLSRNTMDREAIFTHTFGQGFSSIVSGDKVRISAKEKTVIVMFGNEESPIIKAFNVFPFVLKTEENSYAIFPSLGSGEFKVFEGLEDASKYPEDMECSSSGSELVITLWGMKLYDNAGDLKFSSLDRDRKFKSKKLVDMMIRDLMLN
jgi:hypothetical protein